MTEFRELLAVIAWPITVIVLVLLLRHEIRTLLSRLSQAKLPGGVTLDFQRELEEAVDLSRAIAQEATEAKQKPGSGRPSIPVNEANAKMLEHGLRPSPSGLELAYYRGLAERDPALALAGLRIELEIIGTNLARGFNIEIERSFSPGVLYRMLADQGAITTRQFDLVQSILRLCNAAVHGTPVTQDDAAKVIEMASVLRDQYLSWLSWGFTGKHQNE